MATSTPKAGAFPSPYEIGTPPGCDGWEEMYPYYALFDEARRETDENRFWFWNSMHFPVPMPAFDVMCIDSPYQAVGSWQNRVFAVPPAMGIDYRCVNGYIYISGNPVTDPEKIVERAEFFQRRAGYYFQNWTELYAKWRAKMEALIEEITNLRVPDLPEYEPDEVMLEDARNTAFFEVLDAYQRTLRCCDLMWQHHFEFLLLGYGAYATFADFCKANLPDIPDQHIAQMVAGIDVLLFRPDAELRRLARLAIESGVDSAFVEGRSPDEIDAELAPSEAGRRWLAELEKVKDPWFNMATGDGLYHYYRSWLDDPSIPYASLIGHINALRARRSSVQPRRSSRSATASRRSTAGFSTRRRGRPSTSCWGYRAPSSRTWRSTSSSATTGSSHAGGTRYASSASCLRGTASSTTPRTSSSSAATRRPRRSTSSSSRGPRAARRAARATGRRSRRGARSCSRSWRTGRRRPPSA
jgi:pyruvate, water dikinase